MAVAAILLAFAVLCAGGAALMLTQDKRRPAIIFGAGGGLLLLGAIVVFFTRPGFSSIDDRAALLAPEAAGAAEASYRAAGMNICHIDETRSRITVSNINDVPLKWSATRSEEHTSELQSLMRISYAVFCLKKKKQ